MPKGGNQAKGSGSDQTRQTRVSNTSRRRRVLVGTGTRRRPHWREGEIDTITEAASPPDPCTLYLVIVSGGLA